MASIKRCSSIDLFRSAMVMGVAATALDIRELGAVPVYVPGVVTINAGVGLYPNPPPLAGAAAQPLVASGTNSDDIPVPDWAGVEVEAQGLAVPRGAIGASSVTIERTRQFTLPGGPNAIHFAQFWGGVLGSATATAAPGAANRITFGYRAIAQLALAPNAGQGSGIACGNAGLTMSFSNGSLATAADGGVNTGFARPNSNRDCRFAGPGPFTIKAQFEGNVNGAGPGASKVDFDFSDAVFGPDGLGPLPGAAADKLGAEALLRWKEDPSTIKDSRRQKSTMGTDGKVNFDGTKLSFTGGTIDRLDKQGGTGGGVDPQFAGDPLLNATLSVSDLQFLGVEDGRYKFGPGTVTVQDPTTGLSIAGSFDAYFIAATTQAAQQAEILRSFALLETLDIIGDNLTSPFLDVFTADKLGPLSTDFLDFYFLTGSDLIAATNGFTTPAFDVAAALLIGGNGSVPAPGTLALLTLGLAGLAVFRRALVSSQTAKP